MRQSGIVSAGGKSSRMGQDKALIRSDDETLLHRSVQKLGRLSREVMIVTDKPGRHRTDAAKEVTDIIGGTALLGEFTRESTRQRMIGF